MTSSDPITMLFRHNLWANLRLFEQCASLTGEQLAAIIPGTYGSVGDTLQHIVIAEQNYYARISTGRRNPRPKDAPPLTFPEMLESLHKTGQGLIEWASKVQAADTVEIDWDGVMRDVPKSIILTQVINHATEHRAQIMTTLTQMGIEPPDLQGWAYFDEL